MKSQASYWGCIDHTESLGFAKMPADMRFGNVIQDISFGIKKQQMKIRNTMKSSGTF